MPQEEKAFYSLLKHMRRERMNTVLEEMIEDLYHFSRKFFPNADGVVLKRAGKEAAILAGKDGWDTSCRSDSSSFQSTKGKFTNTGRCYISS